MLDIDVVKAELAALVKLGAEATGIEAKRAAGRLPQSLVETLAAFANTPGGGIVLLGVNEATGFSVDGVDNANKVQHDLASMCQDQLTPSLRPEITLVPFGDKVVVAAEITELPREQKPCYVTSKGINKGSFVRIADGDRSLTSEEVQQLIADRGQPRFDQEPVAEALVTDLDNRATSLFLDRLRLNNPHLFGAEDDQAILKMAGIIKLGSDGGQHPSLAGLLALGKYPQEFFPQLNLTFVHYPTLTGESTGQSMRFIDNVRVDGPIGHIVLETLNAIRRNMARRALITSDGREDIWEYPPEALREAVVNALVHRDLSPGSRGSQVQVEMYPDRLRILNPGGLFGAVDITRLGDEGISSSRNSLLLRILEDVVIPGTDRTVCENRGSGIRTMRTELGKAGMQPPRFKDRVTSFEVAMPSHALFDDETVSWLNHLAPNSLKDSQRIGLALMRKGEIVDNTRYRTATGVDSRVTTMELQELAAQEIIEQIGMGRGSQYVLSAHASEQTAAYHDHLKGRSRQVIELIEKHGELSKREIAELADLKPKTVGYWLTKLRRENIIEANTGSRGDRNTRYRLRQASQGQN